MSDKGCQREKSNSKRRELAIDLDSTDGSKFEYYGREDVYAANNASAGQDH